MVADNIAVSSASARLLTLPKRQQILLGAATVVMLTVPIILTQSLIPLGVILALALGYAVIRNPVWSIFAFIVINVTLAIRPKQYLEGNAPNLLESILGLVLVGVTAYWVIRIRFIENQSINRSIGQLSIALLMIWASLVTIIGLLFEHSTTFFVANHSSFFDAVRELLNFLPLLILPILYERHIQPESREEKYIFLAVVAAGFLLIIWNFVHFRDNIVTAVYLYQTGAARADDSLIAFITLLSASVLLSRSGKRWLLFSGIVFLCSFTSIVISLKRSLYIAVPVAILFELFLCDKAERKRGLRRLSLTSIAGILCLIPIYFKMRIFRLLVESYFHRLLTAQHLGTDLSLANRYVEWGYVWRAITHSPILGYGFGAHFRTLQIISVFNEWKGFTHSSYLFMIFKTGFVGGALLAVAFGTSFVQGLKLNRARILSPTAKIVIRASLAYLLLILLFGYSEPILDSKLPMVWIGLIWGYFLALETHLKKNDTVNTMALGSVDE